MLTYECALRHAKSEERTQVVCAKLRIIREKRQSIFDRLTGAELTSYGLILYRFRIESEDMIEAAYLERLDG
jgi:hypothetical protein